MENLTISDTPQQGAGAMPPPPLGGQARPPQQMQLPAQMFTTAAQLLDLTDSKGLSPWRGAERRRLEQWGSAADVKQRS